MMKKLLLSIALLCASLYSAAQNYTTIPQSGEFTTLQASGLVTAAKGAALGVTIGDVSTNNGAGLRLQGTNAGYNWLIDNNLTAAALSFTPSTATGGVTYTTPTMKLTPGAITVSGTETVSGNFTAGFSTIGTATVTNTTSQSQASGGTTLLSFVTTSGMSANQVVAGTNITAGTTVASIVSTAEVIQAANGSFSSGQKVIPMAVTTGYAAGQQCVDTTTAAIGAGNVIASIQAGVSITLTANTLTNSSGAADSITCDPVVTLSAASTGTIASGATISFYANATAATVAGAGTMVVNGGEAVLGNEYVAGKIQMGSGVTGLLLEPYTGGGYGAIYNANVTPGASNYALATSGTSTILNGTTSSQLDANGVAIVVASSTGAAVTGSESVTNNGISFLAQPTTGTSSIYSEWTNTGNSLYIGLDNSTAGGFNTAGNYGAVIYRSASTGFAISRAGTIDIGISTAGAVTIPTSVSTQYNLTLSQGRVVNTTASASTITISAGVTSTYIATPGAAITVTLAAPVADGERRRIVFAGATTVTWAVTSPATAVAAPTVMAAGTAIELVYNSVAGTPANSAATTWYQY